MIPLWAALLMIPATWALAAALVPRAARWGSVYSVWPLIVVNTVGISGSILALLLVEA